MSAVWQPYASAADWGRTPTGNSRRRTCLVRASESICAAEFTCLWYLVLPVQNLHPTADIELVDMFVARQPVLDGELKTWGYELLYRSSVVNSFPGTDGTLASLDVINTSFFAADIGKVAGGKRAFVNFTRELLLGDAAYVLSPEEVVIEVLEGTPVDDDLRTACQR